MKYKKKSGSLAGTNGRPKLVEGGTKNDCKRDADTSQEGTCEYCGAPMFEDDYYTGGVGYIRVSVCSSWECRTGKRESYREIKLTPKQEEQHLEEGRERDHGI